MKGTTRVRLLVLLAVCIAATLTAALVCGLGGGAAVSQAEPGDGVSFDASVPPPSTLPVVFVSGTAYDMGVQYGQQTREMILANICSAKAQWLPMYGTWDNMVAAMLDNEALVDAKTPEITEMMAGIADGAGVSYEEILLLNVSLGPPPACSTISAWGRATKGRKLISGINSDTAWFGAAYTCILVAFPSEGNSFINAPAMAGGLGNNGMNAKGLVSMGSAGQAGRPEDRAPGYPSMLSSQTLIWNCNNVAEARDKFLGLGVGGCVNNHLVDPSGSALVIEYTSAIHKVRTAGDFGEKNYLVATNGFLHKDMQPAMYTGPWNGGWYHWWPRYVTEKKLLKDGYGKLTPGSLMKILGSHDYWDGKKWHRNVWSMKPAACPKTLWTPGMRHVEGRTVMREIFLPSEKAVYFQPHPGDPRIAGIPNATGEFSKLVLADSPAAICGQARSDAQLQIWYAARNLDLAKRPPAARDVKLNDAKLAIWEGINLQNMAGTAEDPSAALALYGQATTCFCKAQCYAEQAQGIVSNSGVAPPSGT